MNSKICKHDILKYVDYNMLITWKGEHLLINRETQVRVEFGKGLLGYKGILNGKKGLAIIKGQDINNMIGFISNEQLLEDISTGPYINYDNYK